MMVNYLKSEIMLCCLFLAGIAAAKPIQPPAKENPMLAEAQYKYGVYCKKTLKDEKKAFQYLELAAKQNYRQAWVYLAECYLAKNDVHPSYFLWAKLCLQAAERLKADAETEYRIGLIEALTGNLPEFKHWMKLAADKGHKNAASLLNDSRIHKKIISFRQKQERKQQRNALKNSINAHFKKLQQTLGDDADEMIEQLSLQRPVSTISKMIRLPHPQDIILPGWNYDPAQTEALIEKNLMADREGGTRWMTEEFFKQPLWENLLYPNPTIRAINATHEEELIGSLNKSPFRRCKKEEIKSLIKPFMDSEAPKDYYDDDAVWDLGNNLYFRLHVASDGAWQLPDYQFFVVRNGKSIHVETFPNPPSVADAALVAGIVKNNPACWNNLAVKYADGEMDQVFRRDDDAEEILKNLVKSRHAIGTYNLAIFYQNRKKNAEAKKYFALAETFAGNSVISPLVNSPEIFDRNGTLLVKNRLFRTHKENIRIYTKGGCFAAPLIGLIQTYSNPKRTRAEYDRTGVEEIIYRQNPGLAAFLTLDCALQSKLEKLMTDIAVKSDPLYAYGIIVNSSGELIAAAQSSVFDAEKRKFIDLNPSARWTGWLFLPAGYVFPIPDQWMKLLNSSSYASPKSKEKFNFHRKQGVFSAEAQGIVLGLNRMKNNIDPKQVSGQTATMMNYLYAYIGVAEKKAIPAPVIYTLKANTPILPRGDVSWISFYRPPDGIVVNALGVLKTANAKENLYICVRAVHRERDFRRPASVEEKKAAAVKADKAEAVIRGFSFAGVSKPLSETKTLHKK